MHQRFVAMIVLCLFAVGVPAAAAVPFPQTEVDTPVRIRYPVPDENLPPLTLENPLFWHSENALDITASVPRDYGQGCGQADPNDTHPCWAYRLTVAEEAAEMRVGIDLNRRGQCFELQVWEPGTYNDVTWTEPSKWYTWNNRFATCPEYPFTYGPGPEVWNGEVRIKSPREGDWVVRVVPLDVENWGFRLRAALVADASSTTASGLPNIRALPPYEFGFAAPSHPDPGKAYEYENGGSDASRSCIADDVGDGQPMPERCLRLSSAIYNVGEGDLELRYVGSKDGDHGDVTQYIRTADGVEEHFAGEWEFHESHGHHHHLGMAGFELFRVVGPGVGHRELEPVSVGAKWGWGAIDQRMADWDAFDQGAHLRSLKNCRAISEGDSCAGQTSGWGDHYRWQRPGNFVEFPTNPDGSNVDGDYVVRVTMDVAGNVLESNEDDNIAYAWIRVQGNDVSICERGYGASPWDPQNEVLTPGFWVTAPAGTTTESPTVACDQPPHGPR